MKTKKEESRFKRALKLLGQAWHILLGRDKETDQERRQRYHRRMATWMMSVFVPPAVAYSIIMSVMREGSVTQLTAAAFLTLLWTSFVVFLLNRAYMWGQKKGWLD